MTVQNLVSRQDLDVDETGFWARLPWVSGGFFGLGMGTFAFVDAAEDPARATIMAVGVAVVAGLPFGWLLPRLLRRSLRSINDKLYYADATLVTEPASEGWLYRVPSSLLKSPRFAVGGVLYLGPSGMLFVPHHRNRKQNQEATLFAPLGEIGLSLVPVPQNALARLLSQRPPMSVRVSWPGGAVNLMLPAPERTMHLLLARISELKASQPPRA